LRSNSQTKDIPILAATAMFRPADLRAWLDVGCNDYILKPFTLDELSRKIRGLIE
jgi:CheY-like chemotaxis protein